MNNITHNIKKTNISLILICLLISIISIFLLYMISKSFLISKRVVVVQIISSFIGLLSSFLLSSVDYHSIAKLYKIYIPISIILMLLTFEIGFQRGTADDKAWIILPFGISIQPSEFLKICFILSFSLHLSLIISKINELKNIIFLCCHGSIPILLTHLQGDDGAALMFIIIFITILFSSGISWKYIIAALFTILTFSPLVWYIMNQDQKKRILITLHPETDPFGIGYQQFHGLISIGNGGLIGKGTFKNNYIFVPEIQNDFIFSFIGQVFGYIGSFIILSLLIIICLKILAAALKAEDYLGKFICVGVFAMMISQIIFNIGMNLSILPVIGITLPLLSAGGSSIITIYFGIGLVLSVFAYNNKCLFYKHNK